MGPCVCRHDNPLTGSPAPPSPIRSERTRAQLPAAEGNDMAEGTATPSHRCLHPAGEEHSASAGTQPKTKMLLDLRQGATGLPALDPQLHHLRQTPGPQKLARIASPVSPGSKAGLAACWGGPCPHALPFSNKPATNLMERQQRCFCSSFCQVWMWER